MSRLAATMLALSLIFLLDVRQTSAGWFGPATYQECILENMKGVTSDEAARSIRVACAQQFPRPDTSPRPATCAARLLTKDEKHLLKAKWRTYEHFSVTNEGNTYGDTAISVSLYNGNSNIALKSITVRLSKESDPGEVAQIYKIRVDIAALSTGGFEVIVPLGRYAPPDWSVKFPEVYGC
jgi:hypothetical protein